MRDTFFYLLISHFIDKCIQRNPSTHDVYKESPPYMLKEEQNSTNFEKLED